MTSETKTEKCNLLCEGCECYTDVVWDFYGYQLCEECTDAYVDRSGHCSLQCCLTGRCDESC